MKRVKILLLLCASLLLSACGAPAPARNAVVSTNYNAQDQIILEDCKSTFPEFVPSIQHKEGITELHLLSPYESTATYTNWEEIKKTFLDIILDYQNNNQLIGYFESSDNVTLLSISDGRIQYDAYSKDNKSDSSLNSCVDDLTKAVSQVYENYEIHVSDDKKSLLLYLWQDGMAFECVKAKSGISPYVEAWNDAINSLKELSLNIQNFMDTSGHPEVSTSVVVRNDQNLDATLLMIHKGRVILDVVND